MADAYADKTVLLLPFNTDTKLGNGVVNRGLTGHFYALRGNAALTSAQAKYGGTSCYFDGSGDSLLGSYSPAHACGTSNFTLETWFMPLSIPAAGTGSANMQMIYCDRANDSNRAFLAYCNWNGITNAPGFWFNIITAGVAIDFTYAITLTLGRWYHVAVTRNGANFYFYLDGVRLATKASTVSWADYGAAPRIGCWSDDSNFWLYGYLDDFRLTNGVDRYGNGADFTVPDALEYAPVSVNAALLAAYPKPGSWTPYQTGIARRFEDIKGRRDIYFSGAGDGQIVGTVKEKATPDNLPLSRKVLLLYDADFRVVQSTWSDNAGNYAFRRLDRTKKFTAVAIDHTNNYRAVISDNLNPEAMP